MISSTLFRILLCLLQPIFGHENWNSRSAFNFLFPAAKHYLFIANHWDMNASKENITFGNVVLVICGYLVNLASELQCCMVSCVLGISATTIWVATSNFFESVQNGSFRKCRKDTSDTFGWTRQFSTAQLHEKFNELLDLADAINGAWSVMIFWYLLYSAVWFSTNLDRAIKYQSYFLKIYIFYTMGFIAVSVILSAESSRKVKTYWRKPKQHPETRSSLK